ncbi:MAG: TIGR01244 family phosphatase [Erythrobacter sp.]|nr:TIGR01244 family phosphatase [Erythrobacter sp.]
MSDFRKLSGTMLASPQLRLDDIASAAAAGVTLIINNRPDGEEPGAPQGAEIEAAARAAGIDYRAIPIRPGGFDESQAAAMQEALERARGTVLAYCRTGTRSTLLWALAQARAGADPVAIGAAAENAGYDVAPVRAAMDALAAQARS